VNSRLLAGLAVALVLGSAAASFAADPFVVIVNPSVTGTTVRRPDLAAVFLRKVVRWGDRSQAVPVDQSGTSPVRQAFSEAVLKMPLSTVLQYWQKEMFGTSPRHPPLAKPGDAEVIAFVAKTPGSVGYVSVGATLPSSVRAVEVVD